MAGASTDPAVREASDAFRERRSLDAGLSRRLGSFHCGKEDGFPVFGRPVAEFAKSKSPFADPESHYDRLCADDTRAACFRLKEPS